MHTFLYNKKIGTIRKGLTLILFLIHDKQNLIWKAVNKNEIPNRFFVF